MESLRQAGKSISDKDFVNIHDVGRVRNGKTKDVPPSGKWGGVVLCAEVAKVGDVVAIRNSNDETKTTILMSTDEWAALSQAIKDGLI